MPSKRISADLLNRTMDAIVFDWDGTAVATRTTSARVVRRRVVALIEQGVDIAVVSGTHVANIDNQLQARPDGPGRLFVCTNRGSEVYEVRPDGPRLLQRRVATPAEEKALDSAAAATVAALSRQGLQAALVSARLNRRKIDLIPTRAWHDPRKSEIGRLLDATTTHLRAHGIEDLAAVVAIAHTHAVVSGLEAPKVTSDGKYVEIGLTDKGDSMSSLLRLFAERGVGPGLVLIVGDEFGPLGDVPGSDSRLLVAGTGRALAVSVGVEPGGVPDAVLALGGGPRTFRRLLDEQLERRRARRVPHADVDPEWVVTRPLDDPLSQRVSEAICTLGAHGLGVRGSVEEADEGASPLALVNGVYWDQADRLLPGPLATGLILDAPVVQDRHLLDLSMGVLHRRGTIAGQPFASMRFVSLTHPGVLVMRAEGPFDRIHAGPAIVLPPEPPGVAGRVGSGVWATTGEPEAARIVASGTQRLARRGGRRMVERFAAYLDCRGSAHALRDAEDLLDRVVAEGFERELVRHRTAWARRWETVNVRVEGDPEIQLGLRYALFQLWCNVAPHGESAVGARGLSGSGYAGHVFWDADVFVLPALLSIAPAAAAAMLRYRIHRLPEARRHAAAGGYSGARFPWESARTGADVTPGSASLAGLEVPILTGSLEEHITADVAWAADLLGQWTGPAVARIPGVDELLMETARYWASRASRDSEGRGHITSVIGPDEYHEDVNDNAFTNVLAGHNLRLGAREAERSGRAAVAAEWRNLAGALVDGYDESTGRYEQFAGYFCLEPLVMSQVAAPPVAADLLLGRERTQRSQIIKQPDVLMLHHMVPDLVRQGSLVSNIDFYGPRTAHGSSLSPSITAALHARAGRADDALAMFREAVDLDVGARTETTAAGLHMANLGGVWQALLAGFAGVRVSEGALCVDPKLPESWGRLQVDFRCLGRRVRLDIDRAEVTVLTDGPLPVRGSNGETRVVRGTVRIDPSAAERRRGTWR